jgi:integration host factor subunit alpha
MTLTKASLIRQVHKQHKGLTRPKAVEAVEAFLRISKNTLANGNDL